MKSRNLLSRAAYEIHGPAAGDERTQCPDLLKANDHHLSREEREKLGVILEEKRAERNAKLAGGQGPSRPKYRRGQSPPLVHADPWNLSQGLGPNGIDALRFRFAGECTQGENGVHKRSAMRPPPITSRKVPSFTLGIAPWSEAADPPLPECGPQVSIPLLRKKRKAATDTGLGRFLPQRPASVPPGASPGVNHDIRRSPSPGVNQDTRRSVSFHPNR